MYVRAYSKLLLAFIMHSVTSFLDFQTLKLIHFQKKFQGGARQSQVGGGGQMLPPPPWKKPGKIIRLLNNLVVHTSCSHW